MVRNKASIAAPILIPKAIPELMTIPMIKEKVIKMGFLKIFMA